MRSARTGFAAVMVAAAVVPSITEAAPKPPAKSCKVVPDRAGDATPAKDTPAASDTNNPNADLTVVDFGTNRKNVLARFHLVALNRVNTASPTGRYGELTFLTSASRTVPKKLWFVIDARGETTSSAGTTVVVDEENRFVDVSGPLGALELKPGTAVTSFRARIERYAGQERTGQASDLLVLDSAASNASYVIGAPTCLPVPV